MSQKIQLNGPAFEQFIENYLDGLLKDRLANIAPEILPGTSIHYIALAVDINSSVPLLDSRIVYFAAPRTPEEKLNNSEWAKLGNTIRQTALKPSVCFDLADAVFRHYVIVIGSLTQDDKDFLRQMDNRIVKFLADPTASDATERLKALIDDPDPVSDPF